MIKTIEPNRDVSGNIFNDLYFVRAGVGGDWFDALVGVSGFGFKVSGAATTS